MLNKNQSNKRNSWKYFIVLPSLIAFVFLFQIEVIAQEKLTTTQETEIKGTVDLNTPKNALNYSIIMSNKDINKTDVNTTKIITEEKPLIVVNEILRESNFDLTNIDPSTITNKEILKGLEAIYTYGVNYPYVIRITTTDKTYWPKPNFEKALIIVDGKETDYNTYINLKGKVKEIKVTDCRMYEGTSEFNKKSIILDYGLKAKNGVMVVKTIPLDKEQAKEVNGWKVSAMPAKEGIKQDDVANQNKIEYFNAVIIIDGEISDYTKEFCLLNSEKIASIKVQKVSDGSQKYKDEMVSKYGEKALNGIVEVETKLAFK